LAAKLKPWVTQKIVDYLGETEDSLVNFVIDKVKQRTPAREIADEIGMVCHADLAWFFSDMEC
jgi:hypothetical protein